MNILQELGQLVKNDLESKDLKDKFDKMEKDFLIAYAKTGGHITKACVLAGHSRRSFHYRLQKNPEFEEYAKTINEMQLDLVEQQLMEGIHGQYTLKQKVNDKGHPEIDSEGNPVYELDQFGSPIKVYHNPINMGAVIFKLKTQAKKRGYVERQEVTGAEGQPLGGFEIVVNRTRDRQEVKKS